MRVLSLSLSLTSSLALTLTLTLTRARPIGASANPNPKPNPNPNAIRARTRARTPTPTLSRPLGAGGFGKVHCCCHKPSGRHFALKHIDKAQTLKLNAAAAVLSESSTF